MLGMILRGAVLISIIALTGLPGLILMLAFFYWLGQVAIRPQLESKPKPKPRRKPLRAAEKHDSI